MKALLSIILSLSLISCASHEASERSAPPSSKDAQGNYNTDAGMCVGGGIECIAIWILVYGSIATVKYVSNEISNLTKFTDSIPSAIAIKCQIQSENHEFVRPCGPFTADIVQKSSGKTHSYGFVGYDNQINIAKGKNRVSVKLTQCGLTQIADEVKKGDVINLEFPPECFKKSEK